MERSGDSLGEMLKRLGIKQPKLENAGLEDCALPPDSIMEAFSRAASSLESLIITDELHAGDSVHDPGPTNGEIPDALVGIDGGGNKAPACRGGGNATGRGEEGGGDRAVVGRPEDRV